MLMPVYIIGFFVCMVALLYYLVVKPKRTYQEPTSYNDALKRIVLARTMGEVKYCEQWLRRFNEER